VNRFALLLVAALSVASFAVAPAGSTLAATCPADQTFATAGTIGQATDDPAPATVGISGMAISRYNSLSDGSQIAWVVGDRSANEIAGPDQVLLFALDARDGSLAIRFPLDPTSFQPDPSVTPTDTVTRLTQTSKAIPDMEELSLRYLPGGPGQLWVFDTGDNTSSRQNLNLYEIDEPDLTGAQGPAVLGTDPELDDAVTAAPLAPVRYPVQLKVGTKRVIANVEAGFVDSGADGGPIYLIAKTPMDLDGEGSTMKDDFRVFRMTTRNAVTPETPDAMNDATAVGFVEFDKPSRRVTAASMLDDGSQLVVRAVSGGGSTPDIDAEGIWFRDPGADLATLFSSTPKPPCRLSLNSAPKSKREETIAYRLTPGATTGSQGFAWTHDGPITNGAQRYFTSA
jgi:hypothetical protein